MRFHIRPKKGVDLSLITLTTRAKPIENVSIEPKRQLFLGLSRFESSTENGFCEHLGRHFRVIRQIDVLVSERVDALPVSFGCLGWF